MRTPRAAAFAGIAFSVLFTAALVLVRLAVPSDPEGADDWLNEGGKRDAVILALNLLPFAGIAFLWFIGVVRDRMGHGEDRLFATVFLGSGLLFLAMLFTSMALSAALAGTYTDENVSNDVVMSMSKVMANPYAPSIRVDSWKINTTRIQPNMRIQLMAGI